MAAAPPDPAAHPPLAPTVHDVTAWPGAVSAHHDIGRVINEIIADVKATQTTPDTRPGAVIYIPPGHYDLRTRVVVDVSHLQIKGSGHGFLSQAIRDGSDSSRWVERRPGASLVRLRNTDGHREGFVVARDGPPTRVGRLNSVEFRDFAIDGGDAAAPYLPGAGTVGIRAATDSDSFRVDGMGFTYLSRALVIHGADAAAVHDCFIAECGTCIDLTGASQVVRITDNFLVNAWAGASIAAENAEGLLVVGNSMLWRGSMQFHRVSRANVTGNVVVSSWPGMLVMEDCDENLVSGNQFRRVDTESRIDNGLDDRFGMLRIGGDGNAVTGNQLSCAVDAGYVRPRGATPAAVVVTDGDDTFLASNHLRAGGPVEIVLEAWATGTSLLFTCREDQLVARTDSYSLVPTPQV